MTPENIALASTLISRSYAEQGAQALTRRRRQLSSLLSERRMPARGWDEASLELLLREAALMDSNNFLDNVGVGEREARVACPLVARRHFGLAHGVGRSGDLAAEQPKAAGSSLLAKLSSLLAGDALKRAGLAELTEVAVLPVATGMALTLTLLALAAARPGARTVVWSRCDQKTCVKAVLAAGLELRCVPLVREGDQLGTDVAAVRAELLAGGSHVLCVLSTSSCFAPRAADDLPALARLCAELGVPHVINNAYGVQAAALTALISRACRVGRVDAVVQSTDKNFMVPVGGALVAAPRAERSLVAAVTAAYPGRACAAPALDLLLTLLHLGAAGWQAALAAREAVFPYLRAQLELVAAEVGERVLATPGNPISLGLTLLTLVPEGSSDEAVSFFGSMLFARCISGTRAVPRGAVQTIGGITFRGYGAHCDRRGRGCWAAARADAPGDSYPWPYLTAAAALGTTQDDVDAFCARLRKCFAEAAARRVKQVAHGKREGTPNDQNANTPELP